MGFCLLVGRSFEAEGRGGSRAEGVGGVAPVPQRGIGKAAHVVRGVRGGTLFLSVCGLDWRCQCIGGRFVFYKSRAVFLPLYIRNI